MDWTRVESVPATNSPAQGLKKWKPGSARRRKRPHFSTTATFACSTHPQKRKKALTISAADSRSIDRSARRIRLRGVGDFGTRRSSLLPLFLPPPFSFYLFLRRPFSSPAAWKEVPCAYGVETCSVPACDVGPSSLSFWGGLRMSGRQLGPQAPLCSEIGAKPIQ